MARFLLGILFFCCAVSAVAQRGFQLGVRAIPQFTLQHNSNDFDNYDYILSGGVSGGLAFGYGFNDHISVVSNFLYGNVGQSWITDTYTEIDSLNGGEPREVDVRQDRRLGYLQIPVMFKYASNQEKKLSVFGMVGPQLDVLLKAEWEDNDRRYAPEIPPYAAVTGYPTEEIDRYNRVGLSAVAAVGLDIKLRFNLRMNIQARFAASLLDIEDKDVDFRIRQNGVETQENYWDYATGNTGRGVTRNLSAGLSIGFNYVFIPKFHY